MSIRYSDDFKKEVVKAYIVRCSIQLSYGAFLYCECKDRAEIRNSQIIL